MVQIIFFLRFKQQLQRTRPELIPRLEDQAAKAVEDAGGKITGERGSIRAVFDGNSIGFWLDILLLIEALVQIVEEAAADLYGYSLLVGKELPEMSEPLCRYLAGGPGNGGVFLDQTAAEALRPYITVESREEGALGGGKHRAGSFLRLNEIKIFVPMARAGLPLRETIAWSHDWEQYPALLISGQYFEGKRDDLYMRAAGASGSGGGKEFFPLFIRFGCGGLNALTDSWAAWMRESKADSGGELNAAWEFLFRQRLISEPTPFAVSTARRFFTLALSRYRELADKAGVRPIVILENLDAAEEPAAGIAIEALRERRDFLLLGLFTGEIGSEDLKKWRQIFPRLLKTGSRDSSRYQLQDLPPDLWEIGYACSVLGRFFPADLLPGLFRAAGKSGVMISRAFSLLHALKVLDTLLDPRPWNANFCGRAEAALGERKDKILAHVRGSLLEWVGQKKISPCLRLLEILAEYGGAAEIDDGLIIRCLHSELAAGDRAVLEQALAGNALEFIAGKARVPALRYIMESLLALHSGDVKNIRAVFAVPPPDCSAFPALKAQALLNQSLGHLSQRDYNAAVEKVKEATLISQENEGECLALSYRLLALASLSRRRIGETIDYMGFALENAAKSGGPQDAGMAAYYAASVHLLYGNLSRSQALAEKANRHFLEAGSPDWADRSRFLEGRIVFETGSYQQAGNIFEDILIKSPEGNSEEKNCLLEAWTYRSRVYYENRLCQKPRGGGCDA
ncbi:MAG: hypothetical protein FWH38_07325, partial [Treponema sp.]|nr:hypothetical protein [Treponema sp.]